MNPRTCTHTPKSSMFSALQTSAFPINLIVLGDSWYKIVHYERKGNIDYSEESGKRVTARLLVQPMILHPSQRRCSSRIGKKVHSYSMLVPYPDSSYRAYRSLRPLLLLFRIDSHPIRRGRRRRHQLRWQEQLRRQRRRRTANRNGTSGFGEGGFRL